MVPVVVSQVQAKLLGGFNYMAGIPLVQNPLPQYTGPSGGDVVSGFLNSYYAAQNNMRANQQAQQQQDQFNWQRSMRPYEEQNAQLGLESKKLTMDGQRQNMQFAGEDQARQNEASDYAKNVMRPLQEASARNSLVSQTYGIEQSRQTLDANSAMMGAQLSASQAIEHSLAGLAGFGQTMKSAPTEIPTQGKVTSYGYANDPNSDSNSAKGIGAYDNQLDGNSMAVSPDVERQMKSQGIKMGDDVHLRLANGQVVTRKLADRTMQDEQATAQFGKPLTGRYDFYSPDGVHSADGHHVVGFAKASGAQAVQGMEAGPVRPEQVTNALNQYDALVRNVNLLPPNSPARTRGEIGIMAAQADPAFSGLLKMRDIGIKNVQLGNQVASDIMATPAPAQALFKQHYPQFADLSISRSPDGAYDVVRNVGGKAVTLDYQQKTAFAQAYDGFSKAYKLQMPDQIPATVLSNYAKLVQTAHAADDLDSADMSDAAQKVRMQATGAREAAKTIEAINPTIKQYAANRDAPAVAAAAGIPVAKPATPVLKVILSRADEAKQMETATKSEMLNKAADTVAPRLQTIAPDNGKDSAKLNPAISLAASIFHDEDALDANRMRIRYEPTDTWDTLTRSRTYRSSAEHALISSDLSPGEKAVGDVTNSDAAKQWAVRILTKYGYDTSKGRKAASPTASADSTAKSKALMEGIDKAVGGK